MILAEVLEHLYTAPTLVLRFLQSLLRPGGLLVVQTPNAAAAVRRVKLLMGKNPYDLINEDSTNPLHFREYTGDELRRFAVEAGFEVVELEYRNYFDLQHADPEKSANRSSFVRSVEQRFLDLLPPTLRTGITMVLRS